MKEDIGELNPKQAKLLSLIKKNNDRLIRMINELLDLSRIESGKFKLNLVKIDLNNFVKKVFEDFKMTVKEQGYIFEENLHPEEFSFVADEDKLSQVLLNLLQNAYKYTEPGQTIGVKTRVTPNQVIIEVYDSGKGLDSKEIDKVFESFYQIEEKDVKELGGLGLGLTISKYIINTHGGTLEIASKIDFGTRVICSLPRELKP
ncbi:HAMP domain-containing histidine kinase [bacterium]|nr:HAMP domain-containing histidine kinase [bacterium]